jgi:lipopolysaccharide/colanic/teichoic acid biosynthesis glycosyltransferase
MTNRLRYLIFSADLLWMTMACVLTQLMCDWLAATVSRMKQPASFYLLSVATISIVWTILYFSKRLEGFSRGWYLPTIVSQSILGAFYLIVSLLAFGSLARIGYSPIFLLGLSVILPLGFIGIRCLAWRLVKSWSRLGATRRVVIVGSSRVALEIANKIGAHPEMMIEVVGFLYPSGAAVSNDARSPQAGKSALRTLDVLDMFRQKKVQELILVEHLPAGPETDKLITSCFDARIQVHFVPQWYELYMSKARLTKIGDVPLVSVETRTLSSGMLGTKKIMDLAVGSLLFALASPLLAAITIALKWKNGKALKREFRCGLEGAQFGMYRFNVDRWAHNLDHFEGFLARFSLTELPQLVNVVRGEMSLVGPRPESPERVKHYSAWQMQRLRSMPGLTGLAQVHGLREHHSSEEKARFDLQYVYDQSLFLDLSIFLQTIYILTTRLFEERRPNDTSATKEAVRPQIGVREALNADSSQSGAH